MIETLIQVYRRRSPEEGGLSFFLLFAVIVTMIVAVLDVGWVPEDNVVILTALLGLLMGAILAKRPLPTWMAWTLITLYGLLIITLTLARLWPPFRLLFTDWSALRQYWLTNGATFLDRTGGWFTAVAIGGRSNETLVFAFIMGLLAWFLAAFTAWSAYRLHRPLTSLILMGLVVALNGFYGGAANEYAVFFVGIAVLATAVLHLTSLEFAWQKNKVDYSREIRLDMVIYAAGIGAALLALSYLIPSISPSKIALAILGQPAVTNVEETLDRAFGGVQQVRGGPPPPGQAEGAGIMPRSFLLGNPPELEKIIMMTANAQILDAPADPRISLARHWRALSYEIYTGRGWALSDENVQTVPAGETITLPPAQATLVIDQDVQWRYDNRVIRYSLGLPLTFDHETAAAWRDQNDLVRVRADDTNRYRATSRLSAATPEQLRSADMNSTPIGIAARYRQLPNNLPQRVRDLAQEVAGSEPTPYDQARALERFLRQYEYSLDVELPPQGVDPVDFFLFDLQKGYCDYYASAMVVMARSLGLPARLATGFLARPPDETGRQTVRQIDSHSWAEVYFGEYGWVEFEPTGAFLTPHDPQFATAVSGTPAEQEPALDEQTTPIPEREPRRPIPWIKIGQLALVALVSIMAGLWWSRRPKIDNKIELAYYRLQQNAADLDHPLPPSQTPTEFSEDFLQQLERFNNRPRMARLVQALGHPIRQLTQLFNKQQYSAAAEPDPQTAESLWQSIRRPLWLLRIAKRLKL